MRSKSRWIGIASSFALAGNAHANNMALYCEFALLQQAHETLLHCEEQNDPASEARYGKLVDEFMSFFAANAAFKKQSDGDSVSEIRKRLLQGDRNRICREPDYTYLRQKFYYAVSDLGMAEVSKLLSRPRDPSEGDCL